ncbi:MAG TPA: TonB-dependent receptor [Gemmatimonadales bacterium]|nr:TonB-dependent receptor [Gemmatimonadales bacterium]
MAVVTPFRMGPPHRLNWPGAGACLLVAVLRAGALLAQDPQPTPEAADTTPPPTLKRIVVTGKREQAIAPPVATVEVSKEAVARAPASNAYDLIGRSAGIEVHQQGQGPGFASNVVIGGFTSDHSSDVLLVLDGVPINLPIHGHVEGYADWSILSPGAISTTRVIHGPASPLYGDFSLGGVVETYTDADAGGTTASLGVTSFGDVRGWVTGGFRRAESGALLSLAGQREQGWRDNADYWLGNGVLRGWHALGAGRIEGGLYLYGSEWNSPGFVPVDRYNDGDLTEAADSTDGGHAQRYIGAVRYGIQFGEHTTLESQLWGQLGESAVFLTLVDDGVLGQTAERDDRSAVGMQVQVGRHTDDGEFSVGLSGRADWTTYTLDETIEREAISAKQADDGQYQALGMYARWRGVVGTRFLYDLGLRGDLVHYRSFDHLDSLADWQGATDPVLSPKLGASYLASDRIRILGSLARGFRGPVGVIGDPSRPLVTAWAAEVGAEYATGPLQLALSFFQFNTANERIKDPVTSDVLAAGTTRRRGISGSASLLVGGRLTLQASGTLNDAEVTGIADPVDVALDVVGIRPPKPLFHDEPLEPGDAVPAVAAYFGRVGAEYMLRDGMSAYLLGRFTGPFTPIGEPGITTRPYFVLDMGGSISFGTRTSLDVDLLNLLDTKYPEIRASGYINPGAPRSLLVSVRYLLPN